VSICSRVSILQGFKVSTFPIGNCRPRYNSAALPRNLCDKLIAHWNAYWICCLSVAFVCRIDAIANDQ